MPRSKTRRPAAADMNEPGLPLNDAAAAGAPTFALAIQIDGLRTVSEANTRGHWTGRQGRARRARGETRMRVQLALPRRPRTIAAVRALLVRFGPRRLDGDNLQGALKAVRDGIADGVGLDDGDRRWTWSYEQRSGAPAVRAEVEIWEAP